MNERGYSQTVSTAGLNETPRFVLEQPTGDVVVEGWDRPEIKVTVDRTEEIIRQTEATPDQLASFLGKGMLLNVVTSMGVTDQDEGWPRLLKEGCVGGF